MLAGASGIAVADPDGTGAYVECAYSLPDGRTDTWDLFVRSGGTLEQSAPEAKETIYRYIEKEGGTVIRCDVDRV
ncbi:hypothetical protein [Nocardia brasiliensis]|uniref:Uncharacterized protein n=1 Tax=Nocardia brasiliensis (strain ATCC 700358 / HUJEG-1) TaxID=1133849 RepID=K0EZP2_NOCB7|nr:hypothetical protein [Nocardia brasiliensis]AFU02962.1 hypothetical protein O3I_025055 [Nocardia brasiliensis ATCC 700358]OCF86032.1 hypothetical protein AW168_33265 [Nocardia brasiliensis]